MVVLLSLAAGCTNATASPDVTSENMMTAPTASAGHTKVAVDRYLTIDGVEMPIDVRVPDRPGPWPVVVAFHGRSSAFKDASSNTLIADRAADDGLLVFTPTWIAGDPFPLDVDDVVDLRHAASCAVAFAQDWAVELGGDPTDTVVYGFSAGAGPALAALVAPTGSVPDCETASAPLPVVGAVLGDGEYFFPSQPFDAAFDDDLSAMQAEVAGLTDRGHWPDDLDAQVYIWAAAAGTAPRPLDDPGAPNWIEDRDPDGSIVGDLDRLGRLDDGVVDYVDGAHFIDLRLAAADVGTDLEIFPGGHTVDDKVEPLVAALRSVGAGR
jgi:hypothetical protein